MTYDHDLKVTQEGRDGTTYLTSGKVSTTCRPIQMFKQYTVMYDSYLLKDVHSVLVNFPREYAQESMMLYI